MCESLGCSSFEVRVAGEQSTGTVEPQTSLLCHYSKH